MDTIVIGLDGGEWDVIDSMIKEGRLPNIQGLIESGVSGDLKSIEPPVSPPAWSSIYTGKNPGKHGIFDFRTFDKKYRRRSINSTDRKAIPFWQILNDGGISTGLFKVPFTYPPEEVNGFIVTGFPIPSTINDFAYPRTISADIGSPDELFEDWTHQNNGNYGQFKDNLINTAKKQTEMFLDLLKEYKSNFLMTVYDGSDRIQHFFWKYFDKSHPRYTYDENLSEAIFEYYSVVDEGIGKILKRTGPNTDVILVSDHGFGPLSYDVRIDEWFEENGYLSRVDPDFSKNIRSQVLASTANRMWSTIKKVGLGRFVKNILPQEMLITGQQMRNAGNRQIEWGESKAFFTSLSGQAININLEDRFVEGVVSKDEYEEVVEELRSSLMELKSTEGKQIIKNVYRTDEIFDGPEVENSPDLIVESAPKYTLKGGRADKLVEPSKQYENDRSGDHRKNGIFVAHGPSFDEGSIKDVTVMDIAPTILHLHECTVPDSLDGRVLEEVLVDDNREVRYTSNYSTSQTENRDWTDSEQEELEDRLEDMGYLQ